ncbi:MAG: SpoIIE family protein phosphatase [Rhodothermaceae bacterium]|nr:SpoIIE family protein phosphatase [Rhodothermaceae bacterium]
MNEHSVLIVEDNPTLRRLLEYRIGKHYDVRAAEHGEEALEFVETRAPDLIISDIMMPKMDGFALLKALRRNERTATIPFIFLTAKSDEASRAKGLSTGIDDYITKPFDIDYVLARVEQIIQRSQVYQTKLNARIGRDFSDRLMPKTMPREEGYRALFFSQPKEDGGGDLFDWVQLTDGSYLFTIGDIMGKGLQAKFYAFSFLSYIRSTIHAMLGSTVSPATLMRRVNAMLIQDQVLEETFASLLLLRWEPARDRVTYCNAGHCRPILVGLQGAGIIDYSDLILGLDPQTEFTDKAFTIPPGSALLCYTDGLNEQVTKSGQQFGEAGVALSASEALQAPQPIKMLLESMLERSADAHFADDILAFWLQRDAD